MAANPDIKTIGDTPRVQAKLRGDKTALIFEGRQLTFAELDRNSNQVANALLAEGISPQSRVGFLDKNSDRYSEVVYGCGKSNAVVVGVNWRLAGPEIIYILNNSETEILFVGKEFISVIEQVLPELTTVRKIISMEEEHKDWELYTQWRDRAPSNDPAIDVPPDDTALQLYTSGTTGHPKGVMLTHNNMFAAHRHNDGSAGRWFEWEEDDIGLVVSPNFHIAGAGYPIQALYAGATTVVLREFDPLQALQVIEQYGITKFFMVPAAIQMVLQHPQAKTTDFSSLRFVTYGASPIPLDLLREALSVFGCDFCQQYGMTETSGTAVYLPPEDHDPAGTPRMRSAGIPMPGMDSCIKDDEGNILGPDQIGEICMRGDVVMKGYWKNPEATAKTIEADGWLRSGDAGYMDADGYLYVHDRIKDMIVSGAENVYPAEVESAIFGHPDVADVAVIGIPSERWGEEVKAIVVLNEGTTVTPNEIIAFTRQKIAGFKLPKSVDFVKELPRNPSGKILKKDLRAPYWEGKDRFVN